MFKSIRNCLNHACESLDIVAHLTAVNLALRQQLIVLKHNQKRPRLRRGDRLFWIALSRMWSHWRDALKLSNPRPSFDGTAKASRPIGVGNAAEENAGDQRWIPL